MQFPAAAAAAAAAAAMEAAAAVGRGNRYQCPDSRVQIGMLQSVLSYRKDAAGAQCSDLRTFWSAFDLTERMPPEGSFRMVSTPGKAE